MNLVRCAWRTDVNPRLMLKNQIRFKILGFRDTLTHLDYSEVYVLKLSEFLKIIVTLPALDISLTDAGRVLTLKLKCQLQKSGIKACAIVKQRRPNKSGKQLTWYNFHNVKPRQYVPEILFPLNYNT